MTVNTLETQERIELRAARSIARVLMPAEDTIDQSIISNALLIQTIAQARLDASVAAESVHKPMMSAIAAVQSLGEARHHAVTCHQMLSVTRDERGLDGDDVGCTLGKKGIDQQLDDRVAA